MQAVIFVRDSGSLSVIAEKPLLMHQINVLRREGVYDITVIAGTQKSEIESILCNGVRCVSEPDDFSPCEDVLVCDGSWMFDVDVPSMVAFHKEKNAAVTVLVQANSDPMHHIHVEADRDGKILEMKPASIYRKEIRNLSATGIRILRCDAVCQGLKLTEDFINHYPVYAYRSGEYACRIASQAECETGEKDLLSGYIGIRNKRKPRKAVFLDRDGTLNVYKNHVTHPSLLEFLTGAGKAVAELGRKGYLTVLITNQPGIAKGYFSESDLEEIFARMDTLLSCDGTFLDAVYYCPHHPDKAFAGKQNPYGIVCDCRKPNPGMILKAAEDLNIDIANSYMVGDTVRDVGVARNAGCIPVRICKGTEDTDILRYSSLLEFVNILPDCR